MKTIIATTIALVISTPAYADGSASVDSELRPMPEEVKANIEDLREYGDRFEKAIAAIEAEWAKPEWSEGSDCEQGSVYSINVGS